MSSTWTRTWQWQVSQSNQRELSLSDQRPQFLILRSQFHSFLILHAQGCLPNAFRPWSFARYGGTHLGKRAVQHWTLATSGNFEAGHWQLEPNRRIHKWATPHVCTGRSNDLWCYQIYIKHVASIPLQHIVVDKQYLLLSTYTDLFQWNWYNPSSMWDPANHDNSVWTKTPIFFEGWPRIILNRLSNSAASEHTCPTEAWPGPILPGAFFLRECFFFLILQRKSLKHL